MKIKGRRLIAGGKWLQLENIDWEDQTGNRHVWEAVSRKNSTGAAMMIARLVPSDRILLVRQFRPPAETAVLEFPAGLIDPGETPAETAVRELREETGYQGTVDQIYPPANTSPGLTGEFLNTVLMTVREEEQGEIRTDFQDSEDIETLAVPLSELRSFVEKEMAGGRRVDVKVLVYALGLSR